MWFFSLVIEKKIFKKKKKKKFNLINFKDIMLEYYIVQQVSHPYQCFLR